MRLFRGRLLARLVEAHAITERIAFWVDLGDAYVTYTNEYIESVWWGFAELWRNKLVYQDLRVSLYCPRCSTPLSNFEIAMTNNYIDADDPAVAPFSGKYSREKATALKAHAFDRKALGDRGMKYERLDQLTIDLLLGVR